MKIEIIIKNKEELQYLQSSLAAAIHKLSQSEDLSALEENNQDNIYWLSKILVLSYHQH